MKATFWGYDTICHIHFCTKKKKKEEKKEMETMFGF